jgi:hypothetical protein
MTSPIPPVPHEPTDAAVAAAGDSFTQAVTPWLAAVSGPTFPTPNIVDPLGITSANAAWARATSAWISNHVLPALRAPFDALFGRDARIVFDQLPYAVQYADTLQNFLVRVPDQLFAKVRTQVQQAADQGTPIPDLARQIKATLLDGGADYWRNRGETIARTELRSATQGGLIGAYTELGQRQDLELIKQWLDSHDTRVREAHRDTDRQRRKIWEPYLVGVDGGAKFPAMFPGDPILPPGLRINCRCDQLIEEAGERMTSQVNRGYRGDRRAYT